MIIKKQKYINATITRAHVHMSFNNNGDSQNFHQIFTILDLTIVIKNFLSLTVVIMRIEIKNSVNKTYYVPCRNISNRRIIKNKNTISNKHHK